MTEEGVGGGSTTMSDSDGGGAATTRGQTTSGGGATSGMSSGGSKTSLTTEGGPKAPTTTISTIAVQSGNTRIVIALLQSAEWLELRVVELAPGMCVLGSTLEETQALQQAHEEVLSKLQSKQSPVEDLLNQADQLISTQRPRAEVYAAMAESLGLAWKNLNGQLDTRKQVLDMSLAFHMRARQYSEAMDAAERLYTDNVLPGDAETVRQLLAQLHDHKRTILEASMYTLQEAQQLLNRLKALATEGASLDSRPQHIRTNIDFACSQVEHYLESLHDRRRFLDGLFSARKHHLDECLALCILYQELTTSVTSLKKLRDDVSQHQSLGESQNNTEILLHEHLKREQAAKEQQDKCIHLLKTAEGMCSTGHYAGVEARARAYSVLEAATALHETCDTRTALLQQSILFFKLANTALTKFDQAEVQVATLTAEGSQRLSVVVGIVEEAVQPALTEGYAILEVTGGRNQPHNMGISEMIELLEKRRANLSSLCVSSTEQVLQRTELSNSFLEQYNSIESWLSRIGDAFLQGHQDPGGSLSLAKDFLHLHLTLNNDVMEKKHEIDALVKFLEQITPEINSEDVDSFHEKLKSLMDHWTSLKNLLDVRIQISEMYVKFHEDAEAVTNELEALELLLRDAKGEDRTAQIEAKWESVQKMYLDLTNTGKSFCQEAKNAQDPYLDVNRAVLCVETILEHLGKRRLVVTDLHSHYYQKITITKEMITMWKTYKENVTKMQKEMSGLETDFCPLLRGNTTNPELLVENLENRLSIYVQAVKKSQEDIQNMMTRAEVMSYKGDEGGQRDEVISSLLQLYQNLQNKATEYQILSHMLIQFLKNISEIHRSCNKLESQFGAIALDVGGVEGQMLEHEASRQAVLELLNYARKEADAIIKKIRDECPADSGSQDITIIEELLVRRGKTFEDAWTKRQQILEKQLKRSQYHVDLQVISDQLRDLSEQLGRMRGHYGDSLGAALNMQNSFQQFQATVDMLEKRIHTFTSTAIRMLGSDDHSGEIKGDLGELENKWSTFHMQVGQSKKSIEISIEFFRLAEEAEEWFKEGSKLLIAVAGESANVQSPEQAESLKSRIDVFLKPGKEKQEERIKKISSLAIQLYGDTAPRQVEMVTQQNLHMIESFTVINQNIVSITENLRIAEEQRKEQEKHNQELANKLSAAQVEAEVAKLATAAAEEARRAAEEVARNLAKPVEPIMPRMVEVNIQTEAIPMEEDKIKAPIRKESPPPKKVKLIDDEPQHMPPVFVNPLIGATVTEGIKFSFECKVVGFPMPNIEWFKDGMNMSTNPDYKTSMAEGLCKLTIEETFTEDTAKFTCRASNAAGIAETSANLIVKEAEPIEVLSPPVFMKRLVDSTALEGASYQLEATVQGNPLPVVSWAKDGTCVDESPDYVITYNNGDCVLRFEEVFLEDQAEYVCKATNDLGEDTTKAKLKVTAIEVSERPKMSMPLSNVMARAGQKFKLECHVTGTPTPTLTWFHNSKPIKETLDVKITFDGRVATLVTLEAFPKNAGTYTAVAKNTAGEAQTSCNVSVKGRIPTETSDSELASDIDVEPVKPSVHQALKDMSVKEGKSARLDCVIIGQPEPEVIWYHDDKPVKESTDFKLLFHGDRCSLVIQEAFLEDAGIYRVVAMNSAGEASTACFLNIEPSPELSPSVAAPDLPPAIAPRFSALLTDSHVTEGNSAALRAAVTGTPMPTIAWFREGIPLIPDEQLQITESPDGNLTVSIPFTTLDHTGQYEVVATNPAGTAKCVAYLSIETKLPTPPPPAPREPPTFTRLITDTQVVNGQSVVFEAEVSGRPVPTVHWTLNDDVITGQEYRHGVPMYKLKSEGNKHTFEITEVLKPIAGRVTIVAENITGRATSAAQLRVVDPPPVVQPVGTQTTEESHVTKTSTTSSSMERRTQFMETTHTTKVVTSSGGPDQTTKHSTSATQTSQMKKVDDEPVVQVHGTRMQDVTQKGEAPPVISNKVSIVKMKGDKIVKEAMSDSTMVTMPQPKSIMATMPQPTSTIVTMSQPETTIVTMSQPTSAIETMQQPKSAIVTMPQSIEPMKVIDAMKALNTTITAEPARVDLVKAYPVKPTTPTIVAEHIVPDESMQHVEPTKATEPMVSVKPTKPLEPAKVEEHMKITEPMDVNATIKKVTESEKRPAEPEKKAMPVKKRKTIPARFLQPLQGAIAHEDDKVTLECAVDGNPEPSVTWTKNGGPIPTDAATKKDMNRRSLFIPRVSQTHAGRYTCVVANEAGTAQSTCDLVVKKTQFPPVIGKRLQPLQVGCGERLHLEVDVTGTPPPTVIWTKDGQPIIPDDRVQVKHEGTRHYLVIQPATLSDVGRYGASATNSAGRAESLADVLVTTTVAPVIDKSPQHQRMFYSDVTDDARMFTTRSEEKYEDRQCKEDHENTQKSSEYTREGRKPKFEEFKQTTQGTPGASSPYSEDTYYAMRDESDVTTEEGGRKRKKIEVKSETHVEVMSDKKVEVSESTNVDMSPNIKKKDSKSHKHEPKIELKDKKEDTNKVPVTSEATEDRKPKSEDFKRQTKGNSESEPFSKDSYYVKKDESNISTKSGRNIHKVEIKSETHVEVMTDKRFEVVKTTNVDLSPKTENRGISIEHKYQKLDGKSTSNQIPVKETKPVEVATTKSENLFSLPLPTPGSPPVEGIITQETSYVVDKVDVKSNLKPPQMVPVQTYLDEPFTVITETTDKTILDKKLEEQILIKEDRLETINTTEETTELTKSEPQIKVSEADSLKSTTLVKQAVVNQSLIDENKEKELDLKPFPFEPEPEVPKKPRGPPPPTPKKFVKGEFYESDYDSDYDGKFSQKWKVSEDEEAIYTKIGAPTGVEKRASLPHERTPTPPIKFEKPPKFDGPPRPKIEFPESEPEPEKEMSPEIIIPEKIEVIPEAVILKVQAKETKVFKSAAPKKEIKPQPPRVPSPVLQPEPPPEEGYAAPQPRKDPFANGIGVESTKITKIEDSSQFHRRFVTKVHTTRVIKFGENTRASETPPSREATPKYATQEIHKTEPMPDLEPFPFKVEPQKPRKERGPPPTAPKKFLRGEFSESDYESDFEGRIRPKWQPPDSDTEDITYEKVKIPDFKGRTPSKDRENTPTPPNVFDTSPPETGGPLRPALVPMESLTVREPSPEVFIPPEPVRKKIETPKKIPAKPKQETHKAKEPSPPLPAPGPTPEEGVIVKETCYVIDKVDLKTKIKEPKMTAIQTYQDEPYTIVTETTERTTVDKKLEEEMRIKNEILETKTITTTEYEQKQMPIIPVISPEVESKLLESFPKLEPFPFEPEPTRPKKNRGPPPTMPKKFIKGEFTESDYESDYEGRPKPKWKPTDSDAEDLVYQNIRASLPKDTKPSTEKERTPTPPTKFEIPQPVGGPLRPSLERFEPTDSGREPSPEIVIPKVEEKTKSPKVSTPKAPTIKKQQQVPSKPKLPSPVLPEPGPNPEYGYAKDTRIRNEEEKEDFHIRMIKKKMSEKTTYDIDIDITDIYDYISESEPDKTDSEIIPSKPFPKLEPFPYEPDPEKPKRERGGPPPRPKKFLKGEFRESDYDSDVDSHHIQPRWHPIDSEDEPSYRRVVAPPVEQISHQRSESSGRDPTPPTQFDQPPHFEGPPRPVAVDLPRRERRESLEEYSIPKFPKVEFKPFDLEDDETTSHKYGGITTDTETEPETNTRSPSKTGMDKKYAATAQKVVGQQFEDMTQTFRHKAQKFAEQLVTEVFAGKEGSEPTEIAGEPPVVPTELRSPVRDSDDEIEKPSIPTTMAEIITSSPQEPQAYRDEKRASEFGTAHLDPDSGLIYFKYDFGYEFGVILPGEGKKVEKRKDSNREETIPFPVIHIKPDGSQSITNGHVKEPTGSSSVDLNAYENNKVTKDPLLIEELDFEKISPQPSIHSEISEADLEYQQYMGNVIPEFTPKKQAQFRPISGEPYPESEATARPDCVKGRGSKTGMCGSGRPTSTSHMVQGSANLTKWS